MPIPLTPPLGSDPDLIDDFRVTPSLTIPRADPYPAYDRLRKKGPVFMSDQGVFLVSGYDEATLVLKEPQFGRVQVFGGVPLPDGQEPFGDVALFANPPTHGRLRSFMSRAFMPKQIAQLRQGIQSHVDRLLDRAASNGGMDLISELALPLPVGVIGELIGVPAEDHPRCVAWSRDLGPAIEAVFERAEFERAIVAGSEFREYLREQIAIREAHPSDDVLTSLVAARKEGGELSEEELIANTIMLFVAGHETTVNLLGNAVVLLSTHPDERERLAQSPELFDAFIDEVLRYESPIALAARIALSDLAIGDQPVYRGESVWVLIGAANRDPKRFLDPKRFDIGRSPNPHLAFGSGIHFCLGAALARLEGMVALKSLFDRFPKLRLTEEPLELRRSFTIRGYQRVPIAW